MADLACLSLLLALYAASHALVAVLRRLVRGSP